MVKLALSWLTPVSAYGWMGGWAVSFCEPPAPRWKGAGHFPTNGPSSFGYSQSSPMTSNINLAHNLGCPSAFCNQQRIQSLGPDDNHSFVVTLFSHSNPDSQSIQRKEWCFRGLIMAKVLQKMNRGKAGLRLITKDPTIKPREWTRSLSWSHSKRLCCYFAHSFSAGQPLEHPESGVWAHSLFRVLCTRLQPVRENDELPLNYSKKAKK